MVRRTRFWKGKKWQFAVKQQQQNDDGDDVAMSTDDSHFVFCNQPALNAQFRYVTNMTSTRKYSWWSFLPRSLFEQYRRAAYWYFTAMAALSLAPFSPYNRFSVWLPLAFVLILGILRELWEDLCRYRGDNLIQSLQQQQQQHNSTLLPTQMVSMPQQQPPLGVVTSPHALSPASTPPQNLQLLAPQ
ncbi:unnamed protein product [Sphagnum tenellum]